MSRAIRTKAITSYFVNYFLPPFSLIGRKIVPKETDSILGNKPPGLTAADYSRASTIPALSSWELDQGVKALLGSQWQTTRKGNGKRAELVGLLVHR